jgi:hypothetical protein
MMKENIDQIAQPTAGFLAKIPGSGFPGNSGRKDAEQGGDGDSDEAF